VVRKTGRSRLQLNQVGERPASVIFVSHTSELFGGERSLATLVLEQQRRGRLRPIVIAPAPGPLVDLLRNAGVEVRVQRFGYWLKWTERRFDRTLAVATLVHFVMISLQLSRSLRRENPALVYTNTLASPFGGILALFLRTPHVWHIREFTNLATTGKFRLGPKFTLWMLRALTSAAIFNSQAVAKHYREALNGVALHTIYNGFDFPSPNEVEAAASRHQRCVELTAMPTVTFIGFADKVKNFQLALDALDVLVRDGKQIHFSFVGGGDPAYLAQLDDSVRRLGLTDFVEFSGFSTDLTPTYHKAALVGMTSTAEGFGRSLVEALALGIPAIAVNGGGLPEIVEDEKNGLLVPLGGPVAFAHAVVRILGDKRLYLELSKNAVVDARERFSKQRYVDEVENVFAAEIRR
jgi:glycosyltransferase involved in cell wall biosynthesis